MSVQLIPREPKARRKFTPQQKLQILKEWEATGNGIEVAQKNQIHPQALYRWKKALEQGNLDDLNVWPSGRIIYFGSYPSIRVSCPSTYFQKPEFWRQDTRLCI